MRQAVNFYHPRFQPVNLQWAVPGCYAWLFLVVVALLSASMWKLRQLDHLHKEVVALQQERQNRWRAMTATVPPPPPHPDRTIPVPDLPPGVAPPSPPQARQAPGFTPILQDLARAKVAGLWLERIVVSDQGDTLELEGKTQSQEVLNAWLGRLHDLAYADGSHLPPEMAIHWSSEDAQAIQVKVRMIRKVAP